MDATNQLSESASVQDQFKEFGDAVDSIAPGESVSAGFKLQDRPFVVRVTKLHGSVFVSVRTNERLILGAERSTTDTKILTVLADVVSEAISKYLLSLYY
jgi:hypothetical protein